MTAPLLRGAHAPRVLFPAPRRKILRTFDSRNGVCLTLSDHGQSLQFVLRHIGAASFRRSSVMWCSKAFFTHTITSNTNCSLHALCQTMFTCFLSRKSKNKAGRVERFFGPSIRSCNRSNLLLRIELIR